jgi:carboxymethylenebutenolidase
MYTKEIVEVGGSPMESLVFQPEGDGPFPGLVVAQHIPVAHAGLEIDPFVLDVGERLAAAGYASVTPFVFHWWPPEESMEVKRNEFHDDNAVKDMAAAFDILAGLERVDDSRLGIVGHCWGGRLSWLGACHEPRYKAAVVLYGGRIKSGMGEGSPPPISLAGNINCPVCGIFGNDDQNPSPDDVADLDAALNAAGVAHEFHGYDGAGHGFQDFNNPERYREAQAEDAWVKLLTFLDGHLK